MLRGSPRTSPADLPAGAGPPRPPSPPTPAEHGHFDAPELHADKVPILPQRVIGALQQALPDDGIVTCDAGENRIFMTHYFQSKRRRHVHPARRRRRHGLRHPRCPGRAVRRPDRPAVAVCGDGGFAIGMNGLMTAREESLPIMVVCLNNQALGWVKHGQRDRQIACTFAATDHAAMARAMGCEGIRVESPDDLVSALAAAVGKGVTTVIDVVTSLDETFEKVTSPLLR